MLRHTRLPQHTVIGESVTVHKYVYACWTDLFISVAYHCGLICRRAGAKRFSVSWETSRSSDSIGVLLKMGEPVSLCRIPVSLFLLFLFYSFCSVSCSTFWGKSDSPLIGYFALTTHLLNLNKMHKKTLKRDELCITFLRLLLSVAHDTDVVRVW